MRVLELFSGTGSVSKICNERGWEVISLDLKDADINIDILKCNELHFSFNDITSLPKSIGNLQCGLLHLYDNRIKDEDIKYIHNIIGLKRCYTDYSFDLKEINILSKTNTRKEIINILLNV